MGDEIAKPDERPVATDGDVVERPALGGSPLDQLRSEFAVKTEEPRVFKRFPAGTGRLAGEFKPVRKKPLREAAEQEKDEWLMSSCLVRMMIFESEHPEANERGLVPLGLWAGKPNEDPIRFDHRLCDILGIAHADPEEIALALFENNDLLLATSMGEIADWSLKVHDESLQDFGIGSSKTS